MNDISFPGYRRKNRVANLGHPTVLIVLFRTHGYTNAGFALDSAAATGGGNSHPQKVGDTLVGVNLVFYAGEAVALVFVNLEDCGSAVFLDGVGDLLGLALGTARVVASGEDEQGSLHLVNEVDRRAILPESLVLDGISHEEAIVLLQLRVFVFKFGKPVDEGNNGNSATHISG